MDWFPTPRRAAAGIEVPLLDLIPGTTTAAQKDGSWFVERSSWKGVLYQCSLPSVVIKALEKSDKRRRSAKPRKRGPYFPVAFPHPEASNRIVWQNLPYRYRITSSRSNEQVLDFDDAVRLAAFLQSWGFFGLIHLLFNHDIERKEWKRRCDPSGHRAVVQWPWWFKEALSGPEKFMPEEEDLECICEVLHLCHSIERSAMAISSPVAEVCLSIRLFCEYLLLPLTKYPSFWKRHFGSCNEYDVTMSVAKALFQGKQEHSAFLARLMAQRGWCPSIVGRFMEVPRLGLLLTYYLFILDTSRNQDATLHSACTETLCSAHNVNLDAGYITRHVSPRCQCDMVGVNAHEVSQIIARGKLPLVEFCEGPNGPSLSLREGRASDEYTAISHVWSDGLGNPMQNALPRCQLSRLNVQLDSLVEDRRTLSELWQDFDGSLSVDGILSVVPGRLEIDVGKWQIMIHARKVQPSRLFWMDTLCIPVGQGDEIRKRKLEAIERMNHTYAAANRVLVLDPELLDTNLCASGKLETYARIAVSPWLRRSWTFQEGALANYLHFDCADRSLNLTLDAVAPNKKSFLVEELFGQFDWMINRPLKLYKAQFSEAMIGTDTVRLERFTATWNELSRRTTTMSADVYLIFANILGYSPTTISHLPSDQRMQAIVQSMKLLPVGLLYNTGPRVDSMSHHRSRWMPTAPNNTILEREPVYFNEKETFWSDRMVLRDSSLWIQAESAPSTVLLLFDHSVGRREETWIEGYGKSKMKINAHVVSGDRFNVPPNSFMCILMDISGKGHSVNGARVYVTHQESRGFEDSLMGYDPVALSWPSANITHFVKMRPLRGTQTRLTAIYDCPVSVEYYHAAKGTARHESGTSQPGELEPGMRLADNQTMIERPSAILQHPLVAWKLEIECDLPSVSEPLIERPTLRGVVPVAIAAIAVCWCYFVAYLWAIVSYSLRFTIAVQLGWHGTTALYKSSLILWLLYPAPPLSEILFIADRIVLHAVRAIDVAWIVLSITIFWGCSHAAVLCPILVPLLTHRAWSRAYNEDWPASAQSILHKMTFGLGRELHPTAIAALTMRAGYDTLWKIDNKLLKWFLMPLYVTRLAVKSPYKAYKAILLFTRPDLPEDMFYGPLEQHSWRYLCKGAHVQTCSHCEGFLCMRYLQCRDCADVALCRRCVDSGGLCHGDGHWLVPRNYHATVDKRGWLTTGWNTCLDSSGSLEYVEERTGLKTDTRPLPEGMHKRSSMAHLQLHGTGLYLRSGQGDCPTIVWNLSNENTDQTRSLHDASERRLRIHSMGSGCE